MSSREEVFDILDDLIQSLIVIESDDKCCPICGLGWGDDHAPSCAFMRAGEILHEWRQAKKEVSL